MSSIRLFNIKNQNQVTEYQSEGVHLERELQRVIEKDMKQFFGIDFVCSEHPIREGRIDSLGIDENNSPIIFEYKRSRDESVINQGLFYLSWIEDHKDSFKVLIQEKFGYERANEIDWDNIRLICIAGDFTKYDVNIVNELGKNITLIRYKKFGNNLLMFEQVNETVSRQEQARSRSSRARDQRVDDFFNNVRDYILSLGDDIVEKTLVYYTAFVRVKNFVCIEKFSNCIKLYLNINPRDIELEDGFSRDVTNIGHHGTGHVEIVISSKEDLEKSKPLIDKAYNN